MTFENLNEIVKRSKMTTETCDLLNNVVETFTVIGEDVDLVSAARKALKPIKFENADPEMIKYKQWVLWRYELNDKGKLTKVPYSINKTGKIYRASSTNPQDWLTFEDVKNAYESGKYVVDGVGFVFTENDPFSCADFDYVIDPETEEVNKVAHEEAIALNSRVERSPSGTGWHIILYAILPLPGKKTDLEDGTGREMYYSKRFMTMTFDVPSGFPSSINNSEVEGLKLFKRYWPDADETSKTDQKTRSVTPTFEIPEASVNDPDSPFKNLSPTKDRVIEYCRNAPNGAKFDRLFNGNISKYKSKSEADMAIAGMISFHTRDYFIIKEIIHESALWDEKWEREDYCQRTIMTAIRNRWK
jgi:putative DNA primase/helicase